jgi:hypothetical protein
LLNKIAQAQVDKLQIMQDLSIYEAGFANQANFGENLSKMITKLDKVFAKQNSSQWIKRQKDIEEMNERFHEHARSSIKELSNIMDGFKSNFTLYTPKIPLGNRIVTI